MYISVCTDAVLGQMATADAVRALHAIGVPAFEFWAWESKNLPAIREAMEETGMTLAAMCTKFYSLVDARAHEDYLHGLVQSIQKAQFLGCKTLITQVGADTGESREVQHANLVDGLRACVPALAAADMTLVVEPLNVTVDHPGYYLTSSKEGFDIIREVDSPHVRLLFDIYHQQITEGDVLRSILPNLSLIGHFHAAGNPGRHELSEGELSYSYIWKQIQNAGCSHAFGLEYRPIFPWETGVRDALTMARTY